MTRFQRLVVACCEKLGGLERLARELDVSTVSIRRWSEGVHAPHALLQDALTERMEEILDEN